jgi:glycerol kinase
LESTGLGAAYLAGLGIGLWTIEQLDTLNPVANEFLPSAELETEYLRWKSAVAATISFTQ